MLAQRHSGLGARVAGRLGHHLGPIILALGIDEALIPAPSIRQLARELLGHTPPEAWIRQRQGQPPPQKVDQVGHPFASDRVAHFDSPVGQLVHQGFRELRLGLDPLQQVGRVGAVSGLEVRQKTREALGLLFAHARTEGRTRDQGARGGGTALQFVDVEHATAPEVTDHLVHRVLGHLPVGGQLATDDSEDTRLAVDDAVRSRQLHRVSFGHARRSDQRANARPDRHDGLALEGGVRQVALDESEHLEFVLFGDLAFSRVALVGAVGSGFLEVGQEVLIGNFHMDPPIMDALFLLNVDDEQDDHSSLAVSNLSHKLSPQLMEVVVSLALTIGQQGYEGYALGALFVVGESTAVMERSHPLTMNPFQGYSEAERNLFDPMVRDAVRTFAMLDGAFIVRDDGVVLTAGRHIQVSKQVKGLPLGLGARHTAAASISAETDAVAVVVSQSSGAVRLFNEGRMELEIIPAGRRGEESHSNMENDEIHVFDEEGSELPPKEKTTKEKPGKEKAGKEKTKERRTVEKKKNGEKRSDKKLSEKKATEKKKAPRKKKA